jgi:hypothetical protein
VRSGVSGRCLECNFVDCGHRYPDSFPLIPVLMPALVSRFRHFHPDPREFKNNILPCPKPFLDLKEPWLMLAVPSVVGFYWMVMSYRPFTRILQC